MNKQELIQLQQLLMKFIEIANPEDSLLNCSIVDTINLVDEQLNK